MSSELLIMNGRERIIKIYNSVFKLMSEIILSCKIDKGVYGCARLNTFQYNVSCRWLLIYKLMLIVNYTSTLVLEELMKKHTCVWRNVYNRILIVQSVLFCLIYSKLYCIVCNKRFSSTAANSPFEISIYFFNIVLQPWLLPYQTWKRNIKLTLVFLSL
jgi:hypothetical protein